MLQSDVQRSQALLRRVRRFSSFRVACSLISYQLERGGSSHVYRLLFEIGFTPREAWDVIECWPVERLKPSPLFFTLGCTMAEAQAMHFAKQVIGCLGVFAFDRDWVEVSKHFANSVQNFK